MTGIGAVLFRDLIGLLHNLFFAGHFAFAYDANVFTAPSRWGAFVILAPVVGGVIVTFLVSNFAPEAKGHGVPEVMDAIYYKEGMIRPIVALVKSLASAFAIGSGSSVGREGPIIQIGSAIGSTLGQIVAMPTGQRITLVAAGAGAGIAATFNTPIGGVMFAIELMLPEVSVDTFLPVAIATGAATFVGRWFFGDQPAFQVPTIVAMTPHANTVSLLLLYTLLGALVGVAAAGFVRGIHIVEDAFDRIPWRYARHMLGMLLVGVLMYALFRALRPVLRRRRRLQHDREHSHRRHVGGLAARPAVRLQVAGDVDQPRLRLVGRIFSPSLFMGATLGGGFASLLAAAGLPMPLQHPRLRHGRHGGDGRRRHRRGDDRRHHDLRDDARLRHRHAADPGGRRQRRRAPAAVRARASTRSSWSGAAAPLPKALHANMFLVRHAREVMDPNVLVLPAEDELRLAASRARGARPLSACRRDPAGPRFTASSASTPACGAASRARNTPVTLGDVATRDYTVVRDDAIAFDVIARMWRKRAFMAIVRQGPRRPARRRRRRRHHQGARRQLRGEQHEDLSELTMKKSDFWSIAAIDQPPWKAARDRDDVAMSVSANANAFGRPDGDRAEKETRRGEQRDPRRLTSDRASEPHPHELARRLIRSLAMLIAGAIIVILFSGKGRR